MTKDEKKAQANAKRAATLAKKKEAKAAAAAAAAVEAAPDQRVGKGKKAAAAAEAAPDQRVEKGKKAVEKGSNKEVKSQKGTKKRPRTETASGGSPCQCSLLASILSLYHLTLPSSPQEIKGRPIS